MASTPLALASHTASTASRAVAARRQPAAASQEPRQVAALPRRPRKPTCAAAAAAAPAAASDRAALPSRRAFLNGALKVSVASVSLLGSIDDLAEAAPMHRSLSSAALAADAVHSPRAAAAGSMERRAAREFDAGMLPLPLKPFGSAMSGSSDPASLEATHQVCACSCMTPAPSPSCNAYATRSVCHANTGPDQCHCPPASSAAGAVCHRSPG